MHRVALAFVVATLCGSGSVTPTQAPAPATASPVLNLMVRFHPEQRRLDVCGQLTLPLSGQLTLPPSPMATQEVVLRLDTRMASPAITVVSPGEAAGPAAATRTAHA